MLAAPLATSELPLRHAPDRTAEAILEVLETERVFGPANDEVGTLAEGIIRLGSSRSEALEFVAALPDAGLFETRQAQSKTKPLTRYSSF